MRNLGPFVLGVLLLTGPARADDSTGRLVEDVWEVAHLDGARVGHFRTTVRATDGSEGKSLRTTQHMDLTLKRYNALVRLRAATEPA